MSDPRSEFFEHEPWVAGVIGLGYVGLPFAVGAVERGIRTIGFDVSESAVARLAGGRSTIDDVDDAVLASALRSGLEVTTDEERLGEADALFICVPSPLNRHRAPDMRFIEAAAATVARVVTPGTLVSLESTTYPGTTDEVIAPAAISRGLILDEDVFVAFSPERVNPGSRIPVGSIPKVVGGMTEISGEVAAAAYRRLVDTVHLVSSARAAEMAKLIENTYRSVNIAFVNEMAQLAHELDIDIWEVVEAAATKPFGFQAFYPGPGVGGHCVPLDPQYLAWRAKEAGFATRFIDLAEEVNSRMPAYTAARVADVLNEQGLPVFGTALLAVGIAFKPNVSDDRESPALDVLDELRRRGARISVWDPLVGPDRIRAHGYEPVDGSERSGAAAALVLTDHDGIDYAGVAASVPIVFDARGAYRRRGIRAGNIVTL
jgi:UDP-N-acetyl-D-glucosamine dehydrogenase